MQQEKITIEIELKMFQIKRIKRKWYEFFKSKTEKVLLESNFNDEDKILNEIEEMNKRKDEENGKKES